MNVVEKIRKLLRLSASPNVHEARAALAHAHKLAQKHHLEIAKIDLQDKGAAYEERTTDCPQRITHDRRLLIALVQTHFHVSILSGVRWSNGRRWGELIYLGRPADIEIAVWVMDFLMRALRKCRSSWMAKRSRTSRDDKRCYHLGFYKALDEKLSQQSADGSEAAIILHEAANRQRAIEERYPELKQAKHDLRPKRISDAVTDGYIDGARVDLRMPLKDSRKPILPLGATA